MLTWNDCLGPVATRDTKAVARVVDEAVRHISNPAQMMPRTPVIIDGPPYAGKSQTVIAECLRRTRVANARPLPPEQVYVRPWVYVEGQKGGQLASIVRAIAQAMSVPGVHSRSGATWCIDQIRSYAPLIHLEGIVIDDAHNILAVQRGGVQERMSPLKGLLTSSPALVVIVGTDLDAAGVFRGPAGQQVGLNRRYYLRCGDWPPPGAEPGPWHELVVSLQQAFVLPGGQRQMKMRTASFLRTLSAGSLGRPGLAVAWMKEAARYSLLNETTFDVRTLAATEWIVGATDLDARQGP